MNYIKPYHFPFSNMTSLVKIIVFGKLHTVKIKSPLLCLGVRDKTTSRCWLGSLFLEIIGIELYTVCMYHRQNTHGMFMYIYFYWSSSSSSSYMDVGSKIISRI